MFEVTKIILLMAQFLWIMWLMKFLDLLQNKTILEDIYHMHWVRPQLEYGLSTKKRKKIFSNTCIQMK